MKVLIIEDERPAAEKLSRLLKEIIPDIKIMDILGSVEQSINWFSSNLDPDLVFMDIQLQDGISFEIFENCKIKAPIIFTTAYDEYALKAFKVNSVDYLLKPIGIDELKIALDKFHSFHVNKPDYSKLEAIVRQLKPRKKERFLIRIGEHYRSIPVSDINCFYILERNTFILTNTNKNYPVDYSLDKIEKLVDPILFFRISRNFILNFYAIKDMIVYSSSRLKIILHNRVDQEDIFVSRERIADFKKWMDR